MRVELSGDGPGSYRLLLDGHDITESANVIAVDVHADGITANVVIQLELAYEPTAVDVTAERVVVDDATAELLKTLGWTAPADSGVREKEEVR